MNKSNEATHAADEENVPCAPPPTYETVVAQGLPYPNLMSSAGAAVVTQPQPIAEFRNDWMTRPFGAVPNCPHGLEYLSTLDLLLVKQKDGPKNKRFVIKNSLGQNVFLAIEDTDRVSKTCFGSSGSFTVKVCDLYKNEIIHFDHPFACCLHSIEISSPPGAQVIGSVQEEWAFLYPTYKIQDQNGETVLRIKGSSLKRAYSADINYKIFDMNGMEIGQISKISGLAQELFTDDNFLGINFPMDLDVKVKASLISACMLIDFIHYTLQAAVRRW